MLPSTAIGPSNRFATTASLLDHWTRRTRQRSGRLCARLPGAESATRLLGKAAQAPRHGEPEVVPEADVVKLLTTAWTIADGYILNC